MTEYISSMMRAARTLAGGEGGEGGDPYGDYEYEVDEEHFGVHVAYNVIYHAIVFLSAIYASGVLAAKLFKMPPLVGEIACGILLGPNVLNFVPNVKAFVMLGEIGLILLVLEAGIDTDLTSLKLVGARGVMIALVGTFLPILLAVGIATILGYRGVAAISAGCSFAPTSLGIAMNVLRQSNIANTPVGQLIVSAAIIDDMIALVILSQLQAFVGEEVTVVDMAVPIVSALAFLLIGGYLAVKILPKFLNRFILDPLPARTGFSRDWLSMFLMFLFLLGLIPSTTYCKASPLMGAFLAGLVFCSDAGAHHMFETQFKRVMQWLLRIFFAASIGFQVPIKEFANPTVILQGLALTGALLGKVGVGFMAPNFSLSAQRFKDFHLRDCLVVGFSMAAEGEFAFVIAAFAVTNKLFSEQLYSSIILAVLLSTIVAPFCLRFSISYFNKRMQQNLYDEANGNDPDITALEDGIRKQTTVFYCIQTKSAPAWGIQTHIMAALSSLELDIIDHRSWHPRQSETILVNEIYVKDSSSLLQGKEKLDVEKLVGGRIGDITGLLENVIRQPDAIIKAQRWYPEPHLPLSGPIRQEAIVQATGTALAKSMLSSELGGDYKEKLYKNMSEDSEDTFATALKSITHLDQAFAGKLDGLVRHDPPGVLASTDDDGSEAVELTVMMGESRANAMMPKY